MRPFYRWFAQHVISFENLALRLAFVFLLILIISQILILNSEFRLFLSKVDKLEELKTEDSIVKFVKETAYQETGTFITLALDGEIQAGHLKVYINGEKTKTFTDSKITIKVTPGDMLEVDGDILPEEPVTITVIGTEGLRRPYPGHEIKWYGGLELIGWIIPD